MWSQTFTGKRFQRSQPNLPWSHFCSITPFMEMSSIYNYQDPRQFLLDYLCEKQKACPEYSVRKWAKDMNLKGHSLLVMHLQGKRRLRLQHCDFLNTSLDFNANKQAYFQPLIQFKNAKYLEEKKLLSGFLQELHPGKDFKSKEVCEFTVISNWVHMAILAMTELKGFKGSEAEIYSLLSGKVTISAIRSAIIRLMDLELVKWDQSGNLVATYISISTKDEVSNAGVKEYHRQVLDLAKVAVNEQDVEDREFQSYTMAVANEKIPLAKDMIRKFRRKLSKAVSGDGDSVFQTSIQFFQLTKSPKPRIEDKNVERDTPKQGDL